MNKPKTIETQLECRATANLRNEIAEDLSKPDKPLSEILDKEGTEDESQDSNNNSD
jgi:hypothetical protein